jgi:hypothetical protein
VRSKRKTKSVTKMKGMEAYRPKGEVFFLDRPPLLADYRAAAQRAENRLRLGLVAVLAVVLALLGGLFGAITARVIGDSASNGFMYGCGVPTVGPLAVLAISGRLDLLLVLLLASLTGGVLGAIMARIGDGRGSIGFQYGSLVAMVGPVVFLAKGTKKVVILSLTIGGLVLTCHFLYWANKEVPIPVQDTSEYRPEQIPSNEARPSSDPNYIGIRVAVNKNIPGNTATLMQASELEAELERHALVLDLTLPSGRESR